MMNDEKKKENPKSKIRNSKQFQMTKIQITETVNQKQDKRKRGRAEERKNGEKQKRTKTRKGDGLLLFGILKIWILNLFRISCFVLRIYFFYFRAPSRSSRQFSWLTCCR
jgi:hypothetical protein